jgi:LysR family transcriptional regulator, nod-box dependent transcriptional activator
MAAAKTLRSFNLNSLPMLREVLRHGSVTKAAKALNVTQPALSSALKQLRQHFDDELIIRQGSTMSLTSKGRQLLAPLEQALQSIQSLVLEQDSRTSRDRDRIKIAATDYTMHMFSALLTQAIIDYAPNLGVQFLSVGAHSVAHLMSGVIDLIITPRAMITTGLADNNDLREIRSDLLVTQRLLCIGRDDDDQLAAGLSVANYLERPHATLALDADRTISVERSFLSERGLRQNDVLLTSSYSSLPEIVAVTGCLSLVPEGLAKFACGAFPIQAVESPLSFPPLELAMVWHERSDKVESHIRLRELLKQCVVVAPKDASQIVAAS